jgi:hypothetical protein
MFGSSMEAHHLLYAYVLVWLIQGGYAAWVFYQWIKARKSARLSPPATPATREEF